MREAENYTIIEPLNITWTPIHNIKIFLRLKTIVSLKMAISTLDIEKGTHSLRGFLICHHLKMSQTLPLTS